MVFESPEANVYLRCERANFKLIIDFDFVVSSFKNWTCCLIDVCKFIRSVSEP